MAPSKNKTLMEKCGLRIEQLDYKYIKNCKDANELEKILRVLRSGEEGHYPHLIEFGENRLKQVDPNSAPLNPAKPISKYTDITSSEQEEIKRGIQTWATEIAHLEETCMNQNMKSKMVQNLPPVRKEVAPKKQKKSEKQLSTIDKQYEMVNELPEDERKYIANLEKIKGNEAFKTNDYEEAIFYYNRSLFAFTMVSTLNNRAQTYLKMKNYDAAILDCNEVIFMEPDNVKALYRRGTAYKDVGAFGSAMLDFQILLEFDPNNKAAQKQLEILQKLQNSTNSESESTNLIEEIKPENDKGTSKNQEKVTIAKQSTVNKIEKATRLVIEEINDKQDSFDDRKFSRKLEAMLNVCHSSKLNANDKKGDDEYMCKPVETKRSGNKTCIRDQSETGSPQPTDSYINVDIEMSDKAKPNIDGKLQNNGNGLNKMNQKLPEETRTYITDSETKSNQVEEHLKNDFNINSVIKEDAIVGSQINKPTAMQKEFKDIDPYPVRISSPFEFLQLWNSENANYDEITGAKCLLSIIPNELSRILSDNINGEILSGVLKAMFHIIQIGKYSEGYDLLNNLTEVSRIELIVMFMSQGDLGIIKDILSMLEEQNIGDTHQIRKVLLKC